MVNRRSSKRYPGFTSDDASLPFWRLCVLVYLASMFAVCPAQFARRDVLSDQWPASSTGPVSLTAASASETVYPWLYWRQGKEVDACTNFVEVIIVGDIMLGRGVAGASDPPGTTRIFDSVSPWLSRADIALGNFEGVIGSEGELSQSFLPADPAHAPYRLVVPGVAAWQLRDAGFDLMGLANNHAQDLGDAGLFRTVSDLMAAGVEPIGVSMGATGWAFDPYQPTFREVNGLQVAFLAVSAVSLPQGAGLLSWSPQKALEAIARARHQADIVVVSIHWGDEYILRSGPAQQELAQKMIEAGADLVVGHHPHVVQDTQVIERGGRDGFVAYSLGNFVFDQYEEQARQGLMLRAVFNRQGLRGVQGVPVWAGPRPRLMLPDEAATLLERVRPAMQRLGFVCDHQACQETGPAPQPGRVGIFGSGQIDLTGDGKVEIVRRVKDRLQIYENGVLAWESPDEWQVLDAALGDPNDDGRGEVLLAIRKPDNSGVVKSHPFIIGFRGGIYRQIWGGSAVADPILEVELGDLDGDGIQDLVVLEERGDRLQAVTVWRWNGWGFQLDWRSVQARYRDLVLLPGRSQRMIINVGREW